ncbi:MFS transporter [Streptomyces mexicanus]
MRSGRGLLAVMTVIVVCSGVVQGYLTPLLPEVGRHVGVGSVGQNNLYLLSQLAFAVMTPLLSRLGDLYGHRRLLRVSVAMVVAGSLLIAARPTTATLAVGMALQGAVVGFFPSWPESCARARRSWAASGCRCSSARCSCRSAPEGSSRGHSATATPSSACGRRCPWQRSP